VGFTRFSGVVLLLAAGSVALGQQAETKHLRLLYSASQGEVQPLGRVSLVLDIELKPGMHVYAPEVEGTYIPIAWRMPSTPALKASEVTYPKSKKLFLEAINETVPVYEGRLKLTRELTIGSAKDIQPLLKDGELTVEGSFRYQACDDRMCYRPETVPLQWIFRIKGS
jgi:hypothetical protein